MMLSPYISAGACSIIKDLYICDMHFHKGERSIKLDFPAFRQEKDLIIESDVSKNIEYEIKYYRLSKLLLEYNVVE